LFLAQDAITYRTLVVYIASRTKELDEKYQARVLIASLLLTQLDQEIVIDACDKELIRKHLERQKANISLLGD
jgi:DNA polymerase III alpha subunit